MERKRGWKVWLGGRWRLSLAFVVVMLLLLGLGGWWYREWTWRGTITGSGGLFFFTRTELAVPAFSQDDERWSGDPLGPSSDTIGSAGCALTSAAMTLRYYGVDIDPQRLNLYLETHEGYTPEGWLYWEKAADTAHGGLEKEYEDAPSYALLDENVLLGNPVIVRLKLSNGMTHFVVVVGKSGWDYLIRDPAAMEAGVYPLKQRSNIVTGLRYYRKIGPILSPTPAHEAEKPQPSKPNTFPFPAAPQPPMIRLPTDLLFEGNQVTLNPSADPMLKETLKLIDENKQASISVDAYSDDVALSKLRAQAVLDWLQKNLPANTYILKANGHGHVDDVVDPKGTKDELSPNRVEILVQPIQL